MTVEKPDDDTQIDRPLKSKHPLQNKWVRYILSIPFIFIILGLLVFKR
jgi:hypothetical protein